MYGKLFAQMYDGTLGTKGPWQALVTFQQMIILADATGCVDMTPEALSRRTTIPLDIIAAGIQALQLPDGASRTPDEEGRRIVPLSDDRDWGWKIVNYEKYRRIRSEEERREYHRQYARKRRARQRESPGVNKSTGSQQSQPIEDVEAVSSKQEAETSSSSSSARAELLALVPRRESWEAEMNAAVQGMHGPVMTPGQVDQACSDYLGNGGGQRPNLNEFRGYLRKTVQGPVGGGSSPRRKTIAERTFENGIRALGSGND